MKIYVLAGFFLVISTNLANAEICKGLWGGNTSTSVTFHSKNKAQYCYKTTCWNVSLIGNKKKKLSFLVGNRGAKVTLLAAGGGFKATWRLGSRSAKATLSCK